MRFIFPIVLVLAANLYVWCRIYSILPLPTWGKLFASIFCAICFLLVFLYPFGVLDKVPLSLAKVMYFLEWTWFIAVLYLLMAFLLVDILRLCHIVPYSFMKDSLPGSIVVLGGVALVLSLGGIHYYHKYREPLTIETDKPLDGPVRIVLASDLHLGFHNHRSELARWIDIINKENPSAVLIGGDIVDISVRPLLEENFAEEFSKLDAPVYTVLGNHEYYSKEPLAEKFLSDAGITLLRDESREVCGLAVIGRDDRTNKDRKSLSTLVDEMDSTLAGKFTILLDHQPNNLEEAENERIDFQFSGHTHRGQVWPISWITDSMFEVSWGHLRKGSTRYYVSSGLGIWGAKIRIGTRSEYLVLDIVPRK